MRKRTGAASRRSSPDRATDDRPLRRPPPRLAVRLVRSDGRRGAAAARGASRHPARDRGPRTLVRGGRSLLRRRSVRARSRYAGHGGLPAADVRLARSGAGLHRARQPRLVRADERLRDGGLERERPHLSGGGAAGGSARARHHAVGRRALRARQYGQLPRRRLPGLRRGGARGALSRSGTVVARGAGRGEGRRTPPSRPRKSRTAGWTTRFSATITGRRTARITPIRAIPTRCSSERKASAGPSWRRSTRRARSRASATSSRSPRCTTCGSMSRASRAASRFGTRCAR